MVTRQEEKRDANICLQSPKPKGQQRRMRIQVLLLWGFVFIYPALMNMNLPLDREAAVPLRTLHIDFPHPDLPPPPAPRPGRWGIGCQAQGCNCPGFSWTFQGSFLALPTRHRRPRRTLGGCGCWEHRPAWHPASPLLPLIWGLSASAEKRKT